MSWTKLRGKRWVIVFLGKVSDLFLPIIKLLTVGTKQQFQQLQAKCISVGIVLRLDLWPPSCQLCVTANSVESFTQIWALASTDSVFSASAPLLNGWMSGVSWHLQFPDWGVGAKTSSALARMCLLSGIFNLICSHIKPFLSLPLSLMCHQQWNSSRRPKMRRITPSPSSSTRLILQLSRCRSERHRSVLDNRHTRMHHCHATLFYFSLKLNHKRTARTNDHNEYSPHIVTGLFELLLLLMTLLLPDWA